ncbi:hypothetical protein B7494_g7798 [Chlorociboria aeruginascens]|nr:hypothetical protein B7494_g7798 [Chlorociboria aeruginascens]
MGAMTAHTDHFGNPRTARDATAASTSPVSFGSRRQRIPVPPESAASTFIDADITLSSRESLRPDALLKVVKLIPTTLESSTFKAIQLHLSTVLPLRVPQSSTSTIHSEAAPSIEPHLATTFTFKHFPYLLDEIQLRILQLSIIPRII